MSKFRVYFYQINQTYIDVEARTLDSAMLKAKREWKEDNLPCMVCVEQNGEEIWPNNYTKPKVPKTKCPKPNTE